MGKVHVFFHVYPSFSQIKASPVVFSFAIVLNLLINSSQAEADGSNEFNDFQPGSLNTTYQIIRDLENIDMVVHIGDICYANGYLSQWDQFTAQIEPIASTVPYMIGRSVGCLISVLPCYVPPIYIFFAHRLQE